MDNQAIKIRTAQYNYELLRVVQGLMNQEKYLELVELMNERLKSEMTLNFENREFYYIKAMALDNSGEPLEAFRIFIKLREKFPTHPQFYEAFRINCNRIEALAEEIYRKDRLDPALKNLYQLLFDHWYPQLWITKAASNIDVKNGQIEIARERMNALLELSPYDTDYVLAVYEVALKSGDQEWIFEIAAKAADLLKSHPYQIPIYKILTNESLEAALNPEDIH